METIGFDTNNTQQCLVVKVATNQPTQVRCRVYHANKVPVLNQYVEGRPFTDYFNHIQNIRGNGFFYVRLPQCPKTVLVEISDVRTGGATIAGAGAGNVKMVPFDDKHMIGTLPLKTKPSVFDYKNKNLQEAVRHFQWLSEYMGVLSSGGSVYGSMPTFHVRVDVHDYLIDRKTHKLIENGPARIGEETKIIEIAKEVVKYYTVQQRMAIDMHEYGHGYLNKNMADETEADLNSLRILIGLGYSRSEIAKVFLKVFDKFQTEMNLRRWNIIRDFIANFELKDLSYNGDNYFALNK